MSWRLEPFPEGGPLFEGAIAVYAAAFAPPPYNDPDRGEEIRYRLRRLHRDREGFRGFIALGEAEEAAAPSHGVVGMTYGYRSQRGQWWRDAVARGLDRKTRKRWLGNAYELVEIAVHPDFQGQGIGALLVDNLLEGRPESTCVLRHAHRQPRARAVRTPGVRDGHGDGVHTRRRTVLCDGEGAGLGVADP